MGEGEHEGRLELKFTNAPNQKTLKKYFPLPNEIFCLGLNASEIAIYAYLLHRENRKTYQCYPSYNTIGKAVNLSKNTVAKYVLSLEEKCLISTEPTKVRTQTGQVHNGSLMYTIRPIKDAQDHYYAVQMAQLELTAARQRAEEQRRKLDEERTKNEVQENASA